MTCEVALRDATAVARIINLAHRFTCRAVRVDASETVDGGTAARFAFAGPAPALLRLRAQIERLLAVEGADRLRLRPPSD